MRTVSPSCFVVCGHHLSRTVATVFSLFIWCTNFLRITFVCLLHLLQHIPFLVLHFTFSNYVTTTLYDFASRVHLCIFFLLPIIDNLFFFSGRSRSPTRNSSFSCRGVLMACMAVVRSRMTVGPRIPTTTGRSASDFHRPGRHCLHRSRSTVGWAGAF